MINKFTIFEALQKLDGYSIEAITKIYLKIIQDINRFIKHQNNRETVSNLLKDLSYPDDIKKIMLCEIINKVVKGSEAYNEIYFQLNSINGKPPKQQKKTSYVWQGNQDKELPELYNLMINKYKLMATETTLEQFEAVFTGQPIESINPIKWIASNRLLAYFLDTSFSGEDWQSIAGNGKLFHNKKGKTINANDLSVAKKGYTDYGKPKGNEMIDWILSTIKKHSEH